MITSVGYGKSKSDVATILTNTAEGIRQLKAALEQCELEGVTIGDVHAVRINSGLFQVPWEETRKVLEQGELDITVMSPPPTGSDLRRSEMVERDERNSRKRSGTEADTNTSKGKRRRPMKAEGQKEEAGRAPIRGNSGLKED